MGTVYLDLGWMGCCVTSASRLRYPENKTYNCQLTIRLPWQLVIPKFHGVKLTDIPDEDLVAVLVC
jgi:hypothetical protein